ncbi:MAG TPA: hypothetical protein PK668_21785 [Myxococcota bacterium]|nr:hypothetical protein [Myxococcota bacterium]HRY96394.1 hypothetical protein [Myxococcota bacterium]HSA20840.1 hypothetical protein [Myxococcota bacterium]
MRVRLAAWWLLVLGWAGPASAGPPVPERKALDKPTPAPEGPWVAVGRGPLGVRDERVGVLEAVGRSAVRAPRVGLDELEVETIVPPGRRVQAGEVLLTFERAGVEARLRATENRQSRLRTRQALGAERRKADRLALELELDRRRLSEERAGLLAIPGVGLQSALQLEAARLDHELARLELAQAREALAASDRLAVAAEAEDRQAAEELQAELAQVQGFARRLSLVAHARGRVAHARPGPALAPGDRVRAGELVLWLEDEARLQARVCVPAEHALAWSAVRELELQPLAYPGHRWPARLKAAEAGCPGEQAGAPVDLALWLQLERVEPPARPGLRVAAVLEVLLAADVLRVPTAAVVRREGAPGVLRLGPAGPAWAPIRLGRAGDGWLEVLEGVQAGDRVHPDPGSGSW